MQGSCDVGSCNCATGRANARPNGGELPLPLWERVGVRGLGPSISDRIDDAIRPLLSKRSLIARDQTRRWGIPYAAAPRLIISACGILDHPLSRVMTTECVTHLAPLAGR